MLRLPYPAACFVLIVASFLVPACQKNSRIVREPGNSGSGPDAAADNVSKGGSGSGFGGGSDNALTGGTLEPRPKAAIVARDWSKAMSKVGERRVNMSLALESNPNSSGDRFDLREDGGCLQSDVTIRVTEDKERWNIYRLVESYADGTKRTYYVADPPERLPDCPECSPYVSPDEIRGCPRELVGTVTKELPLKDYPVQLEWQIQPSPERSKDLAWLPNEDARVVLSQALRLASGQAPTVPVVQLCFPQLEELSASESDADSFIAIVQASPAGKWPGGATSEPQRCFSRTPITRSRIREQLKKIKNVDLPKVR